MKIGEARLTQSSYYNPPILLVHRCTLRQYEWRTEHEKKSAKHNWPTMLGQHCLLAEGDIGAPIYWRTDAPCATTIGAPMPPAPLLMTRRTQKLTKLLGIATFSSYTTIVSYHLLASGTKIFFKKKRTEHFGVPCLFSYLSPINWALHRGNGNTLKKRRRQH